MEKVKIWEKEFSVFISQEKIAERIKELGKQITSDLKGTQPVFLVVLKGAFLFASDLLRNVSLECEVTFIRVSSYEGTKSTGLVKSIDKMHDKLKDRTVVIIEDIIDTGNTAVFLMDELNKQEPESIRLASLLSNPDALKHDVKIDYVGFEVANDFLVGYGLDYDGLGRNLNDIYKIVE